MKAHEAAGRLFFWGFDGTKVTKEHRALLKKYRPAGVILFRRNLESMRQMRELTRDLKKAGGPGLLIGIDEEGGRVSRLPPGGIKFPPALFWGRFYEREGDLKVIEHFGRVLGLELCSLGVNTNFAPVLDVNSNPKNPIIGDRAFSEKPKTAGRVALAFQRGLAKEGIVTCGKHFPGHGDTATDSHLTLPRVTRSRTILERVELVPFQMAVSARVPLFMTAHVVYDALDPKRPATLSAKILQDLLRTKMKYRGVVISDDLQMKAISKKYSEEEASLLALEAGCDLLLICEGMGKIGRNVMEGVAREVSKSVFLQKRLFESLKRVHNLLPLMTSI